MIKLRKAKMLDIPHIHKIVNDYAWQGLMLRRPLMMLYESVRDFVVAEHQGSVVGISGLHVLWNDMAEIRSLAVLTDWQRKGIGKSLIQFMVQEAQEIGIERLFAFTYQQRFFEKNGFKVVKKDTLPQKVWKECIYCDKFHSCDEIAMIRDLRPELTLDKETKREIPLVDIPLWTVK
jgi:amino-acid N-acetyltransferase